MAGTPDPELVQRRAAIDTALGAVPLAEGIAASDVRFGGVPVVECTAPHPAAVVLYLHGGGFRMGSASAWRAYGSHLARICAARVLVVDYRLAPEHPFPAALDDALSAYRETLRQGVPESSIVVAGDSAGGNLAAALVLAARAEGLPMPAGVVCCSPWVDLTNTAVSYATRRDADRLFSLESANEAAEGYVGDGDRRDPLVSPVFGDWRGAPPVLIQVGDAEVLLDDAEQLADAIRRAGGLVTHRVYPGMPHVWQLGYPAADAVGAVEEIAAFVRALTGQSGIG
jgi:epsilon-lactone hydrolase